MPEFKTVNAGSANIRCAIEGSGPLVVMVHGFPESWYSWRHQMTPIAEAGFTACAIDVRGYGGSDKPPQVSDYAMEHMTADVAGVIDAFSAGQKAVLIGHDWGAPIVWNTALSRPDKVRAVAGLSVPYTGVPQRSMMDMIREVFTDKGRFFYQAWFQDVGPPEAEMETDVRDGLRKFYYAISGDAPDGTWPNDKSHGDPLLKGLVNPNPFPAWLTQADEDYFVGEFEGSGFFGPISRYRNHDADYRWLQQWKGQKIEQPALFIGGERDLVLSMFGRGNLDALRALIQNEVPNLKAADVLEGCGHWTQQEKPAEVNQRLIAWLKSL